MLIIRLEAKDGTTDHPLKEMPATFGRLDRSTVKIEDGSVSREHARLFSSGGKLFIADLNSSNGTFVNETRVSRAEVKPGDTIRLGRVVMTLSETAKPEPGETIAVPEPEEFVIDKSPAREPRSPVAPSVLAAAAAPAAPAARPAAAGGVQVREKILQYHKIDAGKKSGLLSGDISQHHPATRVLVILVFLALAVGLFFLTKWLTESTLPAGWEKEGEAIESGIDD